jgi:NitT/TauT family transport system substrate-binding protein
MLFAALAAVGLPAAAADEKITLMIGGVEKIIYLPVKLAERLGYFREQGLDVELLSQSTGVEAEDKLLAGTVQGVIGFYDHTIALQSKGKEAESVVQLGIAPGQAEIVAKRLSGAVRSMSDLKGKRLGVTGLGASTNFLSQYLVVSSGLKLGDVAFVPVGAGDTFINAVRQGRIDAGMTTEPTISRLLESGEAEILVDLRGPQQAESSLGGIYPAACLYMQTAWVNAHKPTVQKVVNALVKSLHYLQGHGAEEIAALMPPEYYAGDKAMYVKAIKNSKGMFTPDGVMPASGPATVTRVLAAINKGVRPKNVDLARTYTTDFVLAAR